MEGEGETVFTTGATIATLSDEVVGGTGEGAVETDVRDEEENVCAM